MAIPKPGAPARGLLGRWFRVWGFPPPVGNLCPNFQTSLVIRILPVSFFYGRFVEKDRIFLGTGKIGKSITKNKRRREVNQTYRAS